MTVASQAMLFAMLQHTNQGRKYTGEPYWVHLAEVAGLATTAVHEGVPADEIAAVAWLHDVVEDCGVTEAELLSKFGPCIARDVMLLSDLEKGNRATRKAAARARLGSAPPHVQSIKCADLLSNLTSILLHDASFAPVFLKEADQLLGCLTLANPTLRNMAQGRVIAGLSRVQNQP